MIRVTVQYRFKQHIVLALPEVDWENRRVDDLLDSSKLMPEVTFLAVIFSAPFPITDEEGQPISPEGLSWGHLMVPENQAFEFLQKMIPCQLIWSEPASPKPGWWDQLTSLNDVRGMFV